MSFMLFTSSEEETISLGTQIANKVSDGSVILLTGDLGAGKTTFVKGIAKALNIKSKIISPTFNIMKLYMDGSRPLIHIDAYRLEDQNLNIGLDEYIGYEKGITVIEWPNYIKELLPDNPIEIEIKNVGGDKRQITVKGVDLDVYTFRVFR